MGTTATCWTATPWLNGDLDFNDAGRVEKVRRIGDREAVVDAGLIVVTAFISPFRSDRRLVRDLVEKGEFVEVFVSTPLKIFEQRDPKASMPKARLPAPELHRHYLALRGARSGRDRHRTARSSRWQSTWTR